MSWPNEQYMLPNMMGMQPMMWPNMMPNAMQPNAMPGVGEFNMNVHANGNQNAANFIGVVPPQQENPVQYEQIEEGGDQNNVNNDKSDHRDRRDRDRNRDKGRHGRSRERDRDRSDRNDRSRSDRRERRTKWSNDSNVTNNAPSYGSGNMMVPGNMIQYGNMMPHQQIDMANMANMMQPMQMPGMMDQNMMIMNQQMPMMANQPIYLTNSVLLPPIPGIMIPQRMNRPVGCRTVFIGGLPNQITESLVSEMFARFGDIESIKIQKQGVCHVRFCKPESVEQSFCLSGYRFKYQDQIDTEAIPIIVDYALNRDDQDEQERHRRRRDPTPPRIEPFLATTLSSLTEKIKSDTDFAEAAPTLAGWLERGECTKKNANTFYSLIQATNNHIRRLVNEKMQIDEEFHAMKNSFKDKFMHVLMQFEQVAKILSAAKHQRVSDHFTKQQRRNVEMWLKMTEEVDNMKEEYNSLFDEDESDIKPGKNMVPMDRYEQLKKENENLVYELEGYKNEAHLAKDEAERKFETFKAHFIAEQALKNEQPQDFMRKIPLLPFPPANKIQSTAVDTKANVSNTEVPHSEAKLISLITAFLMIHPLGATLDYIVSYLKSMMPDVAQANISNVLTKYNEVFQCKTTGVGANIELKWYFITFESLKK